MSSYLLASASRDESIRLWHLRSTQCIAVFAGGLQGCCKWYYDVVTSKVSYHGPIRRPPKCDLAFQHRVIRFCTPFCLAAFSITLASSLPHLCDPQESAAISRQSFPSTSPRVLPLLLLRASTVP
mmetsp:Transcript_24564/g.67478  ORF Transcript_24564/g.67478 Transcript_24564/m.67478 type:complete len:125 (-) Transcript_24564:2051-2425(-)